MLNPVFRESSVGIPEIDKNFSKFIMTQQKNSFDATTKTFYGDLFKRWGFAVETEREVFSHACSIDLVAISENSEELFCL
ncbi:hypothetical protein QUF61_09895 [Candidatus Venteria ishoeyi]|uniref:Uncharacterized protein n=1 Tax=Candidatus Venteria ishoeyi TaxID=1899563 RepID=A0A1H6F221_9GAMM|nr:hypothetical protein [Candidatus Venteria ishoeyi]MDM8546792.1 hypothetical protein [Candidatus Venteria ishoeyi]SEH04208.1 Uncharacterised protein [Candidatus Venteria ishoeyi]